MIKKIAIIFIVILSFGLGLFVEKNFDTSQVSVIPDLASENVRLGGYKYVSPLLECEQVEGLGGVNFNSLESEIDSYIESKKAQKDLENAAVYFRQFRNGAWFGVNEREGYAPASLLKVPIMMAYLKESEDDDAILSEVIKFSGENKALDQEFDPQEGLVKGESYTNLELLEKLIKYSDNDALYLLAQNLDEYKVSKLMEDLGISSQGIGVAEDYMSVRSYASLFRVLYNASYLSKENSEKALSFLANSAFSNGLRSGVPENIEIAHKFGQRDIVGEDLKQLHDCGIIYHPNKPYLLCIMTRGYDYDVLSGIIGEISKKTYDTYSRVY